MNILALYSNELSFIIIIISCNLFGTSLIYDILFPNNKVPKLWFDDRCFIKRKVLVLIDRATYACTHITFGSSYKGFSIFETKQSTFESLCILLTIVYYFFSLHQFFFPHHLPKCDVNHRMQTMTKNNIHKKLFE